MGSIQENGDMMIVMGDLVLTEDEVTPFLTKLQEEGVEVTALHNHVLHESPRVMYMHIHAMGDGTKIAKSIHDALALSKTPFTASPAPAQNQDIGIDTKQIDQIMGQNGKVNGVVYQYSIARADEIADTSMDSKGAAIPPAMGVAQARFLPICQQGLNGFLSLHPANNSDAEGRLSFKETDRRDCVNQSGDMDIPHEPTCQT